MGGQQKRGIWTPKIWPIFSQLNAQDKKMINFI